jgi:hypothetical protein
MPSPFHRAKNPPRCLADRAGGLGSQCQRLLVRPGLRFGFLVNDDRVDPVAQARPRPKLSHVFTVILGELIRVQNAGIDADPASSHHSPGIPLVGEKRALRDTAQQRSPIEG